MNRSHSSSRQILSRHYVSRQRLARWLTLIAGLLLFTACTIPQIEAPMLPDAGAADDMRTLYVGPELVACTGVAAMECLQVRESRDEPYGLFYDSIEGFDFTPGFEYELLVQVEEVEDPPADASSLRYTLVEIVSQTSVADYPLESTVWLLQEYADAGGALQPAVADSDGFILLENGELGGNSGCNSFFGSYTLKDNLLVFGPIGSTLMACAEPRMSQEVAVFAALEATATYHIIGGTLTLLDENENPVVVFGESLAAEETGIEPDMAEPDVDELEMDEPEMDEPERDEEAQAAPDRAALEDTRWVLTQFADDGALQAAVEESEAFILLSDADVTGSTGCNQFGGARAYVLEGDSLRFGQLVSTLMACMGPVAAQEQVVFAALDATRSYTLSDDTLTLLDEDGAPLLVFVATETARAAAAAAGDTTGEDTVVESNDMPTLEDFIWILSTYRNRGGELVAPVADGELQLSDGAMSGSTGCNRMNAAYTTEDDRLSFGVIATTRMGCAPDIAAQEFNVLDSLRQVAGYTLDDDTLTLVDADDQILLVFVAP